jgi:hypothetical protein
MVMTPRASERRVAARCAFLRVTFGDIPGGHLVNICQHIVRDGSDCVGPFLDDAETSCGLWESKRGAAVPGA